jgi:hypothetical protein
MMGAQLAGRSAQAKDIRGAPDGRGFDVPGLKEIVLDQSRFLMPAPGAQATALRPGQGERLEGLQAAWIAAAREVIDCVGGVGHIAADVRGDTLERYAQLAQSRGGMRVLAVHTGGQETRGEVHGSG